MASRNLSSSLGDSFCLLPTKARANIGLHATPIDSESTLRTAAAARLQNQRLRLLEKQYGPQAVRDTRVRRQQSLDQGLFKQQEVMIDSEYASSPQSAREARNEKAASNAEIEALQQANAHQKHEIMRLLNAVKTLSSENTVLIKKCDSLSTIEEENKEILASMDQFKTHYHQKLGMIKKALEEWRRQRDRTELLAPNARGSQPLSDKGREQQLEQQIAQLTEAVHKRDEQLVKYEKWYQTLKAGARAKRDATLASSGGMRRPKDSFTSSASLQELGSSTASIPASGSQGLMRPPAHPTRRVL